MPAGRQLPQPATLLFVVDGYALFHQGLLRVRPGLSLAFAAALLSLGFIAKFHAVAAGVDGGHGVLPGTLVAGGIRILRTSITTCGSWWQ